jgi:dipeptidyl aminopeptidase/acylaminoacyl peptidase
MISPLKPRFAKRLALALLLAVSAPTTWAQTKQGLSPLQVAQLELVTGVAASPDNRYVAYTLAVPADPLKENRPASLHLYLLDRKTGATTPLYTGASVGSVAFRPGRGTITFLASIAKDEPRALYEIPVTGGTPTKVWGFSRPILAYAWAPDGARIAFAANDSVKTPATPVAVKPVFFEENQVQRRGYVVDVTKTEAPRQITVDGSYYLMAWSPKGDRLAVSVAPTPRIDDFYMFQAVKVVDANSLQPIANIDNKGKILELIWSPDGQQLALRAGHDINDPIEGQILVVPATGGVPKDIHPEFQGKFDDIDWTDKNTIHFVASKGVETVFGQIQPNGTGYKEIVADSGLVLVAFDRAPDGTVAFVANTATHPSEVYLLDAGKKSPRRVTTSNPWLNNVAFGEQRAIRYMPRDSAFSIEGVLVLPVGYTPGTRVPLIVNVHGGPESHYLNGWLTNYSTPGQMGAARGYAVFYPNYRGSTGRGRVFSMSSQGDAAGKEFDDIVDGVDYLIAQGIADSARIGVTGGSYGGYATAWMSTYYSNRFAAGVMFVGISNDISKWGTSDIPHELNLVHSRENMWENKWQKYLERSPIYHVDRAQTPLLIMHGAEDTRVHPAQSLELYRHIVVRNPDVPVRLIFYPGEGHGNARSASRLDYTLRMFGWFDAYLKGDRTKPSLDLPADAVGAAAVKESK